MKKVIICLALSLTTLPFTLAAQRSGIETDIFGDLQFRSPDGRYTASLKEDIFHNLTFSDSRRNGIVFEEKYLTGEYPAVLKDAQAKIDFFRSVIRRHRRDEGYRARFSVDIFGSVVTEDNRGNRTEEKTDIFGNKSYEERRNGLTMSISRDLHGTLQYRLGDGTASLGTAFNMGKWVYKDSRGNRFEFGDGTWNEMIRRHGGDEQVFMFLIS
jgi:hypothetical protein